MTNSLLLIGYASGEEDRVISREIRGMPDEMDYLTGAGAFEEDGAPYLPACTGEAVTGGYYQDVSNGVTLDTEPDIYSFSFLGYSGKFVLDVDGNPHVTPAGEIKMDRVVDEDNGHAYYVARDPIGNQYYFGAYSNGAMANQEWSQSNMKQDCNYGSFTAGEYEGITAWHLTDINTVEGQNIDFEYRYEVQKYNISGSGEYIQKLSGTGIPADMLGEKYCQRTEITHGTWKLTKISTPAEEVRFLQWNTRCDLEPGTEEVRMLDRIEVVGFQNVRPSPFQVIKRFNLKHSYFGPSGKVENCDNSDRNLRLRFDEISQLGDDGSEFTYYRAEYLDQSDLGISASWPPTTSFEQDHWGFFNGSGNTTLDPSLGEPYYIRDRASRKSSISHTKLGMLKRLYYPTGGYTDFQYELNHYKNEAGNDVVINEPEVKYSMALADVYYQEGIRQDYDSAHFTLDEEKDVTIYCNFQGSNLDLMALGFGYVRIFQPGENGINHIYQPNYDCGESNNVILPAGDYILEAVLYSNVQPSSILFRLVWEDGYIEEGPVTPGTPEPLTAGGLRISSIDSYEREGKLALSTRYKYLNEDGTSSGNRLFDNPVYHTEVDWDIGCNTLVTGRLLKVRSQALSGLTRSGMIVAYNRIEEERVDDGGIALGKTVYNYGYFSNSVYRSIPYTPIAEDGRGSGVLLSKEVYNSAGRLLQKEVNDYSLGSFESADNPPSGFRVWPEIMSSCTNCHDANYLTDVYIPLSPQKLQLSRKQVYTYDERSGYNSHLAKTSYSYHSNTNQVQRKVDYISEQEWITTEYQYPFNLTGQVYERMARWNMLAVPTSTSVYKAGKLLSLNRQEFDFMNGYRILPTRQFTQLGENPEELRLSFIKYNSMGNVEEVQLEGDVPTAIIWNSADTKPIAKVQGATRERVWYTSFEEQGDHGEVGVAWSGLKSKENPTIKALFLPPGEYVMSYMLNTGGPNDWGMRTREISLTGIGYTTTLQGRIDEVRIYPAGAQMNTICYDNGGRIMTECTVNGIATSYHYDNYGRLESIKDKNGHILKAFDYGYHNE